MKRNTTKRTLLNHLVHLGTAALLLTASGCTPDEAGQATIELAIDLVRKLLSFWIL